MYAHPACPAVPPVLMVLRGSRAPYQYVNIWQSPAAAARVRAINNGNESVPTLVFADGSTLTEPTTQALANKLRSLGHSYSGVGYAIAVAVQYWHWGVIGIGITIALLRMAGVF